MGKEKYLCNICAVRFMAKNSKLPTDLWFCKKIMFLTHIS